MTQYKATPQDLFYMHCHSGYTGGEGNFSRALEDMEKHKDLDILAVIWYGVCGDNAEFLLELFKYYNENVVNKLSEPGERLKAHDALKEKVEDVLQRNDVSKLNQKVIAVIAQEFPADDRKMEDFDEQSSEISSDDGGNSDDTGHGSSDVEHDIVTGGNTNDLGYGDWHTLGVY